MVALFCVDADWFDVALLCQVVGPFWPFSGFLCRCWRVKPGCSQMEWAHGSREDDMFFVFWYKLFCVCFCVVCIPDTGLCRPACRESWCLLMSFATTDIVWRLEGCHSHAFPPVTVLTVIAATWRLRASGVVSAVNAVTHGLFF
jgi:hypothetical protein